MSIARNGAAKRPQTTFPTRVTMKDMNALSGVGPSNPGTGPDATRPGQRKYRGPAARVVWTMKDATDSGLGRRVLAEGELKVR